MSDNLFSARTPPPLIMWQCLKRRLNAFYKRQVLGVITAFTARLITAKAARSSFPGNRLPSTFFPWKYMLHFSLQGLSECFKEPWHSNNKGKKCMSFSQFAEE